MVALFPHIFAIETATHDCLFLTLSFCLRIDSKYKCLLYLFQVITIKFMPNGKWNNSATSEYFYFRFHICLISRHFFMILLPAFLKENTVGLVINLRTASVCLNLTNRWKLHGLKQYSIRSTSTFMNIEHDK